MSHKLTAASKVQRTCNWCHTETSLLLDIWCDKAVQEELLTCPRNQPVFDRIAAHLQKNGYNRTANQCREKVKTLKKEFAYAQHAVKTGAKKKSDFKFWDRLEKGITNKYYHTRYRYTSDSMADNSSSSASSQTYTIKQEPINVVSHVDISDDCENAYDDGGVDPSDLNGEDFSPDEYNYGPTIADSYQVPDYSASSPFNFDQAKLEKVIDEAANKVANVLIATQARLLEFEERRMKFEAEQEEKRRKENSDHEIKLLNSVGKMFLQAIHMLRQNNGGAGPSVASASASEEQLNTPSTTSQ